MSCDGIRLIVGLGNPGAEYAQTRHNVGTWLVNQLAHDFSADLSPNKKFFGNDSKISIAGNLVRLFTPSTYMNESGKAVLAIAYYYKLAPEQILVAHDELDFPVGTCKIKFGGGHGGHNGLRDIAKRLGSNNFYRLRIGIEHPGNKDKVTGHVLNKPSQEDEIKIRYSIDDAIRIIEPLVLGKFEEACLNLHTED